MSKKILYIGNKLSSKGKSPSGIDTLGLLLENEGYNLVYSSSKANKIARLFDMFFAVVKYSKKVDYILIDSYSTFGFWYLLICSQLARILIIKYIPILHGGNLPNRLKRNPKLSRIIFNNAYINVAPSNYLLTVFNDFGIKNVIYIPNTIEINNYDFLNRDLLNPDILWVRSLSKIYNPQMAIRVFKSIKNEYPEAKLTMVGEDKENLKPILLELCKSLNVKVNFTGKLSKKEWINLSKQYTIFINTTHLDNTPVSVIEAMAVGLPVVSTKVGGIPYLLSDSENALLVKDNNVEEMVFAIKKLINEIQLKDKIVVNARNLVEEFNWDNVKQKWFDILR